MSIYDTRRMMKYTSSHQNERSIRHWTALIKNALALVKGSLYLLIVGGVGHMLHNEEQVIAVFSVCTRITAVTES